LFALLVACCQSDSANLTVKSVSLERRGGGRGGEGEEEGERGEEEGGRGRKREREGETNKPREVRVEQIAIEFFDCLGCTSYAFILFLKSIIFFVEL
jgi:hypothetical protein